MRTLRAVLFLLLPAPAIVLDAVPSPAQVGISVTIAPPPLPVYTQPPIPGPGYLWTPGYWGYQTAGYYWVPGTWVRPPAVGMLWTPGYWGWGGTAFVFHAGYWGPHVGFYGGIHYGFGYTGVGFAGGYWAHGALYYTRSVTNIGNTHITNVYNRNVTVNRTTNVSYNGGAGGTAARPTAAELAATRERRLAPTAAQVQQQRQAAGNRAMLASQNHGKPPVAATKTPGELTGRGMETPHAAAQRRNGGAQTRQVHHHAQPQARTGATARAVRQPAAGRGTSQQRAQHRPAGQGRASHQPNQR
jgi:hypothetical protein